MMQGLGDRVVICKTVDEIIAAINSGFFGILENPVLKEPQKETQEPKPNEQQYSQPQQQQ